MYELMIAKSGQTIPALISDNMAKIQELQETIDALNSITQKNNRTLSALLAEQEGSLRYQRGYTLGLLKAFVDTLPPELAKKQKFNGVPLTMLIKLKVDEEVLNKLEKMRHSPLTFETSDWSGYRRLSELICGYGYNMSFIQERFEEYFPSGMHHFVSGFADAYSTAFHVIAAEAGLSSERTEPIKQDLWKNWLFFKSHEVSDYRLDGRYLFMYHGGINCTSDKSIPYANNVRVLNTGVYEKLQSRSVDEFTSREVNFNF